MTHANEDPVLWRDLRRTYKKLDERIDEAFDATAKGDEAQSNMWDEHEDKIARLTRLVRRLEKRIKELEE